MHIFSITPGKCIEKRAEILILFPQWAGLQHWFDKELIQLMFTTLLLEGPCSPEEAEGLETGSKLKFNMYCNLYLLESYSTSPS